MIGVSVFVVEQGCCIFGMMWMHFSVIGKGGFYRTLVEGFNQWTIVFAPILNPIGISGTILM